MNFYPDPNKQAQEVIFLRKLQKTNHNPFHFNHNSILQVTVYKAFLRPHLNYGDLI